MGTVLVTGGAGFLGKYVARSLADAGEKVLITYRRYFSVPRLLADIMESRVKAVRCDVTDLPQLVRVIRDHGVDSIVHLAHISNYEGTIYQMAQTNVMGTINVLEAAAIGSVKRVTYMSVGGVKATSGETESVPIASPASSNAGPAKCGEVLSLYYGATFGISVVIVRGGSGSFWGPYDESLIHTLLRNTIEASAMGKPIDLPHVGREDRLSLIYARDMAAGVSLLHLAPKLQHVVYVIPGGIETSWGEMA
ncbi:MAG: NAD-dependent epimerase/dehydratase family protein, partial [Chloroflexota bacterium]